MKRTKKQTFDVVAEIKVTVPGTPTPKRTGVVSAFLVKIKGKLTAKGTLKAHPATVAGEEAVKDAFIHWFATADQETKEALDDEPWRFVFLYKHKFFFEMTKSEKKKYKDYAKIIHTKKPDTDNLIKLPNDALEGFIYHNDSQGVDMGCKKYLVHSNPRTELHFILLKESK